MTKKFGTFLIILIFVSKTVAGFKANPAGLPMEINNYWDSIFQFQGAENANSIALGTATIVGESDDRVYLITAKHVINTTCPRVGNCVKRTQITQANESLKQTVTVPNVRVEQLDAKNDLAMVSVSRSYLKALNPNYKLAKTPDQCQTRSREKTFAIGYPAYHLRYGGSSKLPYKKLWSDGQVKRLRGRTTVQGLGTMTMTEISNEVLPGNSGGPTFNDRGEIIGIVSNGDLDSGPNQQVYSTMIATCESTKKMISNLPTSVNVNIGAKPSYTEATEALDLENIEFSR